MTDLPGKKQISKNDPRIEACGAIDELNASLGFLQCMIQDSEKLLREELAHIQCSLLVIAGAVAGGAVSPTEPKVFPIILESAIDRMEEELPPLQSFILPGGHVSAAAAHAARTVCRRAERRLIVVIEGNSKEIDQGNAVLLAYMNRLSDYLFVLARHLNRINGVDDRRPG